MVNRQEKSIPFLIWIMNKIFIYKARWSAVLDYYARCPWTRWYLGVVFRVLFKFLFIASDKLRIWYKYSLYFVDGKAFFNLVFLNNSRKSSNSWYIDEYQRKKSFYREFVFFVFFFRIKSYVWVLAMVKSVRIDVEQHIYSI